MGEQNDETQMVSCIKIGLAVHLPRRGNRTQPRVLTLGFTYSEMCPEGALDEGRRVSDPHNYARTKEPLG
jgi:hypothetical protein